jgi:hypothetical protein
MMTMTTTTTSYKWKLFVSHISFVRSSPEKVVLGML